MPLWNSYATGTSLLTICGTALTAQTRNAGRHRPECSAYWLGRDQRNPSEGFSVACSADPMRDHTYRLASRDIAAVSTSNNATQVRCASLAARHYIALARL